MDNLAEKTIAFSWVFRRNIAAPGSRQPKIQPVVQHAGTMNAHKYITNGRGYASAAPLGRIFGPPPHPAPGGMADPCGEAQQVRLGAVSKMEGSELLTHVAEASAASQRAARA